jgi:hypothetical protein
MSDNPREELSMLNMLRRTIICVALLYTSSIPGSAQAQSSQPANGSDSSHELIAVQKAFIAAQERGDAEYVKNAVASGFTGIETNGNTTDRAEFIRVQPDEKGSGEPPMLYDFKVVQLNRDCAVVTYNGVFFSNPRERYQHVSDVWVNENGNWKLKFQQITLNLWSAHD